jgi:hypothetical protein
MKTIASIEKETISALTNEIERNKVHITRVEDFLKNHCETIYVTDPLKLRIFDMAINKKYPFCNDKNNFADIVIFLSVTEYLWDNFIYPEEYAIFVSNNFKEFGDPNNRELFHPDLCEHIGPNVDFKYERFLPSALNQSKELLDKIKSWKLLESCSINCGCIGVNCKWGFDKREEDLEP